MHLYYLIDIDSTGVVLYTHPLRYSASWHYGWGVIFGHTMEGLVRGIYSEDTSQRYSLGVI